MTRILLFVQRPYPNDHAVLETVFTRCLPQIGFQPIWILQPKAPEYSGIQTEWNGTPVYVTKRKWWKGRVALVVRTLELIREYMRLGSMILRDSQIDIIQARTGLPETLVGLWLAKKHHKPFVFQNSFPLELGHRARFERGRFRWLSGMVYWIDVTLLGFIMRNADLTLAISNNMSDIWKGRGVEHIISFPLGADTNIEPGQIMPVEAPSETVIYFGAMEYYRKLKVLLDTFSLVLKELPTAHLLMVGDASKSNLEEYARQLGIQNAITFTGRVPRSEVPRYIRAARCAVSPIPPIPMYTLSSPTKVIESLAMAVPVVANREIHDQCEVIEKSGGGYAPYYEPQAMADAMLKLLRDPEDAMRRGALGRKYIEANRSYEALTQQLANHYESMLEKRLGR